MRRVITFAALLACTAASPPPAPPVAEPEIRELQAGEPDEEVCRDRIHTVREERGLPVIERGTAESEEPLFIAAVDHRIDGCSVMVMRQNTRDIRPIPKPDERAPLLRPAQ